MSQNTSHAVMAQRIEPHDSLDFFPTPPWATRALCEWLKGYLDLGTLSCWEPACGQGHMSRPLREYFKAVRASDIFPYGCGATEDFLLSPTDAATDFTITNPPFRLGEQFAWAALQRSEVGVALLVRTAFLESADRYAKLFKHDAPTDILQFVERVPMQKGILNRNGSTATAYCWLVWRKHFAGMTTLFHWIAPCRKRLERDYDYEVAA